MLISSAADPNNLPTAAVTKRFAVRLQMTVRWWPRLRLPWTQPLRPAYDKKNRLCQKMAKKQLKTRGCGIACMACGEGGGRGGPRSAARATGRERGERPPAGRTGGDPPPTRHYKLGRCPTTRRGRAPRPVRSALWSSSGRARGLPHNLLRCRNLVDATRERTTTPSLRLLRTVQITRPQPEVSHACQLRWAIGYLR